MLVDSHCHLNYLDNIQDKLLSAREAGVRGFLCIGVNEHEYPSVKKIAEANKDVWATAGVHPEAVGKSIELGWLEQELNEGQLVGVGETGLDYSRLGPPSDENKIYEEMRLLQRNSFACHLDLARRFALPVIVHTRNAQVDTLELMKDFPDTKGVMHCFTEDWAMAEVALELGYYISISGIVTFKNAAQVQEVASKVPADRLLLETDCPWLAPAPHRGEQNQPAFVCDTARFVAQLRGDSYESICELTTNNFTTLFNCFK